MLDSLHEHLNSPIATSGMHKTTDSDRDRSISLSESSEVNAEIDDAACTEDNLVSDVHSTPNESLASFLNQNQQSLLEEMDTKNSSGFISCETNSLQPPDDDMATDSATAQHCDDITDDTSSATVDESGRKVPSIEDFWSKDTKTLNTNVLIAEMTEELAMDSEKFHKMENTAEHLATSGDESLDEEVTTSDQLQELLLAACDGSVSKPVKETNLVANCREKFLDSVKMSCGQTSAEDVDNFISSMKQYCGKPAGATPVSAEPGDDVQNYDNINNIKRIKIDDQAEKNLRMQAKVKVNTEQNQTRSSASPPMASCVAMNAVPADQLIANSSSPVTISAASSQTVESSATSCTEGIITARHVQRAEEAWREYTNRNRSVIIDTFQGQFKSTVST